MEPDGRYGGRYGRLRGNEPGMAAGRRPFSDPAWPAAADPGWQTQTPSEPWRAAPEPWRGTSTEPWRGADQGWRNDSALRADAAWRSEAGAGRGLGLREPMDTFGATGRGARFMGPASPAAGTPTYGPEFAADTYQMPRRTRELQFGTRRYGPY